MSELTITETVDKFVIHGDGYDPDTQVYTEEWAYVPDDGTQGRRGNFGLLSFTDDAGAFTVEWPKSFVIGAHHTPGTFTMTTLGNPATGSVHGP